ALLAAGLGGHGRGASRLRLPMFADRKQQRHHPGPQQFQHPAFDRHHRRSLPPRRHSHRSPRRSKNDRHHTANSSESLQPESAVGCSQL
ncbi:unnamed protein product, partial [Nesidiocoris tenuis]